MFPKFLTDLDPAIYHSDNYIVLDKEVTNLDKGSALNPDNRHLVSVWEDGGKYEIKECGEYELSTLLERIEKADFIVCHNAKFELQWLQREGLDLRNVLVWDTMLAEYVILGNRKKSLALDEVAKRYGIGGKSNYISHSIKSGLCPSTLPNSLLVRYCVQDVKLTKELFLKQREIIFRDGLQKSLFTRCIFTPVLADLERVGMHLDPEAVNQEYRKHVLRIDELYHELFVLTDGANLKSTKQKAELLYETLKFKQPRDARGKIRTTATGNPLTDAATIKSLKATTKKQQKFKQLYIEWNQLTSALSKNLEFFKGIVDNTDDNIFYANFNQSVTQTHRLSSSGKPVVFPGKKTAKSVQFQNFPRTFKRLFNARKEGWKIGERDGAQLEFRVGSYLGRDKQGTEDIKSGFDVHCFTASILNEVELDWMVANKGKDPKAKAYRQAAKADTFKPLYGGTSGTEAQQRYYAAFKERYHGIAERQQSWIDEVVREKKLVTETGLIFYWPDTQITRSGYVTNTPSICNYPVQSLATADIIPIAVTYMWHRMQAAGVQGFIVNTIHDSVITEEPPEEREVIDEIARQAFMNDVYNYLKQVFDIDFNVPLDVDCDTHNHWSIDL